MAQILFPGWREYKAARTEANDAMMALLVAARIGAHTLESSPARPNVLLSDLYGSIRGIGRLDVTVGRGGELMGTAERHLAFMGIPFCLAVHDALTQRVIDLLRAGGRDAPAATWKHPYVKKPGEVGLARVHAYISERVGVPLDPTDAELFRLVNRLRNRIVHHAGVANQPLLDEYEAGWSNARPEWESLTGRALSIDADGVLQLGESEIVAAFALLDRLAHQINSALHPPVISREFWADVVVEDFRSRNRRSFGQPAIRMRKLAGQARTFYSSIGLTDADLEAAVGRVAS